jgi:hypothetical protein
MYALAAERGDIVRPELLFVVHCRSLIERRGSVIVPAVYRVSATQALRAHEGVDLVIFDPTLLRVTAPVSSYSPVGRDFSPTP